MMLKSIAIRPSDSSFHRQVAGKAVGLMVLQGMEERLARIQRHLPAFQQGNYPIDAGKKRKIRRCWR
jgi:hypothetical protein